MKNHFTGSVFRFLACPPAAAAEIIGISEYCSVRGTISFRRTDFGILVSADFAGLPDLPFGFCEHPVFWMQFETERRTAISIHGTGKNVSSWKEETFTEYFPPLFSHQGRAWFCFLTDRFQIKDILNRTIAVYRKKADAGGFDIPDISGLLVARGAVESFRR